MRQDSWGAQELYLLKQCGNLITASVSGHHLTLPRQPQPLLTGIMDLLDAEEDASSKAVKIPLAAPC